MPYLQRTFASEGGNKKKGNKKGNKLAKTEADIVED